MSDLGNDICIEKHPSNDHFHSRFQAASKEPYVSKAIRVLAICSTWEWTGDVKSELNNSSGDVKLIAGGFHQPIFKASKYRELNAVDGLISCHLRAGSYST